MMNKSLSLVHGNHASGLVQAHGEDLPQQILMAKALHEEENGLSATLGSNCTGLYRQ